MSLFSFFICSKIIFTSTFYRNSSYNIIVLADIICMNYALFTRKRRHMSYCCFVVQTPYCFRAWSRVAVPKPKLDAVVLFELTCRQRERERESEKEREITMRKKIIIARYSPACKYNRLTCFKSETSC